MREVPTSQQERRPPRRRQLRVARRPQARRRRRRRRPAGPAAFGPQPAACAGGGRRGLRHPHPRPADAGADPCCSARPRSASTFRCCPPCCRPASPTGCCLPPQASPRSAWRWSRRPSGCWSLPMAAVPTATACGHGRRRWPGLPGTPGWRSPCVTCRRDLQVEPDRGSAVQRDLDELAGPAADKP